MAYPDLYPKGYTKVYAEGGDNFYLYDYAEYDVIIETIKSGKIFLELDDLYGSPTMLRCSAIESVMQHSNAALWKHHENENKRRQDEIL